MHLSGHLSSYVSPAPARSHTQVKGYINRIMVEYAFNPWKSDRGCGGGECLGRERRDKLCGFIEKIEKARFYALDRC